VISWWPGKRDERLKTCVFGWENGGEDFGWRQEVEKGRRIRQVRYGKDLCGARAQYPGGRLVECVGLRKSSGVHLAITACRIPLFVCTYVQQRGKIKEDLQDHHGRYTYMEEGERCKYKISTIDVWFRR
jgi:hypothetical protein